MFWNWLENVWENVQVTGKSDMGAWGSKLWNLEFVVVNKGQSLDSLRILHGR